MPTYDYACKKCSHSWEQYAKIADRKKPESEPCPSCKEEGGVEQSVVSRIQFGDPVKLGIGKTSKPSDGFRDVLRKIHEKTPGSRLDQVSTIAKI